MTDYAPELNLLIDGEWLAAGPRRTAPVICPAHGQALGQLPLADAADLDRALDAAARGFARWRDSPVDERARVLKDAAALLRARAPLIARHATLEQGKPLADAQAEVLGCAGLFEFYAEECRRTYGRVLVRPVGRRSLVTKQPVGPVAAFAPWNFPLHNPARKIGPAVAAGCSVILKPAEETPASALHVAQALVDAGLPPGVVQIVFGVPDEVSRHLLASPVIRKLSFTGSTAVGKQLMRLAADQALRTTMEMGGHAPVLVFDDADIDAAAALLARSKYRNAGQVCISPTRFYVQRRVYDRFVCAFVRHAAEVVVGDGLFDGVQMGPLAHARRPAAIDALVGGAREQGAELLLGGRRMADRAGFYYLPTVLAGVPETARAMNEEPFGPVALMAPFDEPEEAIAQANRLPYGLAGYVFTRSQKTAMQASAAIESGMVGINTTVIAGHDTPFGGIKHSGHGAEDGPEGLEACLVTKTIHEAT
ncbi:NAD-dependent succinate-semialdehyde dehydrogenase [Ideonella sp.]|uniref:NAD-dependent succinate-semialdehyde dehydrogenase n=1 Tax=Ideonella sp. TaxID=1929293 RepID=UPI0035B00B95